MTSAGIGGTGAGSTDTFCRRLVEAMHEHATAFELVDRFRFAAGPLGSGIHAADLRPRGLRQLARLHAELSQEDTLAAARVVRRGGAPGGRRGLARSLARRFEAAWTAFEADAASRVPGAAYA